MTSPAAQGGKLSVRIADFKPSRRNTLVGFANIRIPELHLEIRDVTVQQKGDARWAALPARPQLDSSGTPIRNAVTGKIAYATLFEFLDWQTRDALSRAVIAALLEHAPDAFAAEVA
jgi:hypothetical protein